MAPSAGLCRTYCVAVIWAGFIVIVFILGGVLRSAGLLPVDQFPPLHAEPRLLIVPLLPAVVLAVVLVAGLPVAARELRWRRLLGVSWLASVAWAVALGMPDGLARPLTTPTEYLAGMPAMGDHPLRWLRTFTKALPRYPTHVRGHPPLPMLILWTMRWIGLGGTGWEAALVIAAGCSATAAIAITIRVLTDEDTARRAVPFLVLAPTVIWVATSMDAFFLGVGAWGVALCALASARRGPLPPGGDIPLPSSTIGGPLARGIHRLWITSSDMDSTMPAMSGTMVIERAAVPEPVRPARVACAISAGVLLGALPYLSYGLLPMFALPLAVLLVTRPGRPVLAGLAAGVLVVPVAFTVAGFSWWDGMLATHASWASGAGAQERPYAYFLVGDLAVLALLIGPVAARALPSALREGRALGLLVAAALIGVLALDVAGVTRGEVERIWIPYAAWLVAAASIRRAPARGPLLAQVATALVLEAVVKSPW